LTEPWAAVVCIEGVLLLMVVLWGEAQ
jgi:hypothetical protein